MPYGSPFVDYEPVTRSRRSRVASGEEVLAEDFTADAEIPVPVGIKPDTEATLPPRATKKRASWLLRHGHSVSYAALFLFTIILYFRPYEFYPSPFTAKIAFIAGLLTLLVYVPSQLTLEGTLTARPREINLVLLFWLCGLLSLPLALDRENTWGQLTDTFTKAILIFIVMVNVVRTHRRLNGMLFLVLAVSCVLSVGAIYDYRMGNTVVEGYRVEGVIGGIFSNPNDLSLHLATIIPIIIALLLSSRYFPVKVLYAACAILMTGAIVVTFSRTGFLGYICALVVLAWKFGRRRRFVIIGLLIMVLVALFAFAPAEYSTRVASVFDSSRDKMGSIFSRKALLLRSLEMAVKHPLLGIGMGNFRIVSHNGQVNHNAYLQVATEMGMTAMVIYIMFIVTPLRRLRAIELETWKPRHRPRVYYMAVGLQASLISFMVSSLFSSVAYLWFIYYLVGYAVCLRRLYEADRAASPETSEAVSDGVKGGPGGRERVPAVLSTS